MKIVRIIGGLGNQMFQYAFALALKEQFKDEYISIDISCFKGYSLHQGFQLNDIFNLRLPTATKKEIITLNYPLFHYRLWQIGKHFFPKLKSVYLEKSDMIFDKSALDISQSKYYDGYWQSEKYFKQFETEIKSAFKFPQLDVKNFNFINALQGKEIASIHIRRGDYLNHPLFKNLTELDYYHRGIDYLINNSKVDVFLVFSNDIGWCKENIYGLLQGKEVHFVDWNTGKDSFRDMQLMTLCHHNIVANSSFSWWGAWLNNNENKIIVAPKKWMNVEHPLDIIPSNWIRL